MQNRYLEELFSRYKELEIVKKDFLLAFDILRQCFESQSILFICGNGGSAADSEHIVGELMKGFAISRKVGNGEFRDNLVKDFGVEGTFIADNLQNGFRAFSLMSHPSLLSAFSNDVNAEMIFAQQLYVMAKKGDVLFAISTSGNSKNVFRAIQVAKVIGLKVILLTGNSGGKCAEIADCSIKVPAKETYKIQEYHLPIYHTLCLMIEDYFYGAK